jgi:hypothetical protein
VIAIGIRPCNEEYSRSLLHWAAGDVPAYLCRKGRDGGILADEMLSGLGDEFAQGLAMSE